MPKSESTKNAVFRGFRFGENAQKRAHFGVFQNRSFCRGKWGANGPDANRDQMVDADEAMLKPLLCKNLLLSTELQSYLGWLFALNSASWC